MTQLVPFNYPELFEKAVGVLLPLLDSSPKQPVSLLDLKMALSSYFEESCFRYARNFMSMGKDHDWHWVKVDDYYQRSFNSPENVLKPTASEAFGWVLQHLERNRVFPTAAKRLEGGAVELWVRAQRVATITRIEFASVPREQAQRVERAFKGFRGHEETPQLLKRLASIPGLQSAAYPTYLQQTPSQGAAMLRTPANLCEQLKRMLSDEFGVELRQSQALEVTARMFGAQSWNHFVALSDREICRLIPVLLTHQDGRVVFYRTAGEAIWAFGQMCKDFAADRPRYIRDMYIGDGPGLGIRSVSEQTFEWSVLCVEEEDQVPGAYVAEGERLHEAADVNTALQQIYSESNRTAASVRDGRPVRLQVGNKLFSLLQAQNPTHRVLQLETGRPGDQPRVWLHKCQLLVDRNQVTLWDEEKAEAFFEAVWSEEDRERFADFIALPGRERLAGAGEGQPRLH